MPPLFHSLAVIAALTTAAALQAQTTAPAGYDVALIGDMPYGSAAEPRYERVIAEINRMSSIDLTAHIGDTKSGSTRCDDSHYAKAFAWFNSFEKPVLYSIGDNEWTDCMRANNGSYNPLDRLALIRRTYFGTNFSLGKKPVPVLRQSDDQNFAAYVENAMYVKAPVLYVTLHMPGSNNNLEYKLVQGAPNPFYDNDREYTSRNAANIAWLRKAFQTARDQGLYGVMILTQANVFESFMDTGTGSTRSGYADFVAALREETGKFKGEVVVVSGDSHYMRVHKPLTDRYPACLSQTGECKPFAADFDARGNTVLNFTHVEVPGSSNVHWVLCHVRPGSRNLFNFEFMIVPDPAAAPANGVTPVVTLQGSSATASTSFDVNSSQVALDASKSSSANSGPLAYSWTSESGYPSAGIARADTATPLIQLGSRGTYQLRLTVTDRTGQSSASAITLRY